LPVFTRGELAAVVFFGPHTGGEQIDPEELTVLSRLLEAAGFAFEHVAAQSALTRADELRTEVATLRSLLVQRTSDLLS
jgi:hypothetical protein